MNMQIESMARVQKLARGELSVKARLGYVALLLASSAMTAIIGSLWLTEPYLPLRARLAFGAMSLIGVAWVTLAVWALTTRRVMLARDRVIAGRMSVTFTGLFLAGAIVAVVMTGAVAAFGLAATAIVMFVIALLVLSGARRRFAELAAQREELERELAKQVRRLPAD
jgi:MFS family permease